MNIVIISRDFYPDSSPVAPLIEDIAKELSQSDTVNIYCSTPYYRQPFIAKRQFPFKIKRMYIPTFFQQKKVFRFLYECYFSFRSFFYVLFCTKSIIVVTSLPISNNIFFQFIPKRHALIYINFETVPEILNIKDSTNSKIIYSYIDKSVNRLLQQSKRIVSIGSCMTKILQKKVRDSSKVMQIENWAQSFIFPIKSKNKKCIVSYSGNIGPYVPLDLLCDVAMILQPYSDIQIEIWCDFQKKKWIPSKLRILPNVRIKKFAPPEQINDVINTGDISLILSSKDSLGVIVPSKLYSLMAAKKAIVAITPKFSHIDSVLKKHNCGISINSYDSNEIATQIINLYNKPHIRKKIATNAFEYSKTVSKKKQLQKYVQLIQGVKDVF